MEIVVFIGIIALVVGVIIWGVHTHEKERSVQFQALAGKLGLKFHHEGDPAVQEALGHLRLFKRGRRRKSKNMLSGRTQDVDLAVFGYRFTTGHGKNQRTHKQSVISFQSPHLSLPDFELRPEGMFHKIGQAFGYKDIDFDSNSEFSKRYLLRGEDEPAIRDIFNPELLAMITSLHRVSVEASGDRLIFYRASKRIDPEEINACMDEGFRVFGLFKDASSSSTS